MPSCQTSFALGHQLANWDTYLQGIDLDFRPLLPHRIIDNSVGARPLQDQATDLLAKIGAVSR